jgi:hypothetical protein
MLYHDMIWFGHVMEEIMKTEAEKSMMLAELMEWEVDSFRGGAYTTFWGYTTHGPYMTTKTGLAMFAAILLKFPEVMLNMHDLECTCMAPTCFVFEPTQANILDEILRMNGKEID